MKTSRQIICCLFAFSACAALPNQATAQLAPQTAYVHPAGGHAGTTIDVVLAGYDWTPDLQFFLHEPRIKLEIVGPAGEVLVPDPPYWFGARGRGGEIPMPREVPARITIPGDIPAGIIHWQVANANGASLRGKFVVSDRPEVVETRRGDETQNIESLPVTVSGRIARIAQVDRYRFVAARTGPVSCRVVARQIGSQLNAAVEVHAAAGRLIADAADTHNVDAALTFSADAGSEYTLAVRDVDFRGDRSFVYRLELDAAPRVVAAVPAAGKRGTTRSVRFIGYGIATGGAQLETTDRDIAFAADPDADTTNYALETPYGTARAFALGLSDHAEETAAERQQADAPLVPPGAVTALLDNPAGSDRYAFRGTAGQTYRIATEAARIGSGLDTVLDIVDADGKTLAGNDDQPASTDALVEFAVPRDGIYTVSVADRSGLAGTPAAVYRLSIAPVVPDFSLAVPENLNVLLGSEKTDLVVKATRTGGFKEPITLALAGLPEGVKAPENLVIPADKDTLAVGLTSAADAPATAALVTITGSATVAGNPVSRDAGKVLIATMMRPRAKVTPVDKEGGRTVHRGTTYPAPVIVERLEGYTGEVQLVMSAAQDRHRQGIRGPEMIVPLGVTRDRYPIFLPEWLETSRTSRMILNAVVQVPDPRGNVRYLVTGMDGRITMSVEGALLKLGHSAGELVVKPGQTFAVPVHVSRSPKLQLPVRVELVQQPDAGSLFSAQPLDLPPGQDDGALTVTAALDAQPGAERRIMLRGTALEEGRYPAVSETTVDVEFAGKP